MTVKHTLKNDFEKGHRAGLVSRRWDSQSWGSEFEPHIAGRGHFKKNVFEEFQVILKYNYGILLFLQVLIFYIMLYVYIVSEYYKRAHKYISICILF